MAATSRESLLLLLRDLTADVEALPENIFDDEPGRKNVQRQVASMKAAVETPVEVVLEILLQVCDHRYLISFWLLLRDL